MAWERINIATERRGGGCAPFLYYLPIATPRGINMGKFPEATARLLDKKICMSCYSKNSVRATRCRRCGYTGMRLKAKESRKK